MVFKYHYGLWYGALVGIIPFMFNYANKYSGATGKQHGYLYTLLPFAALLAKPIVGNFADRYAAHRHCLIFFILMTMIGYGSLAIYPFFPSLLSDHKDLVWILYCVAAFIGNTSMCVVNSIGDTLAINSCQRKDITYGQYRLWGPIGFGIFGAIWGIANEVPGFPAYTPGIITLVIMMIINVLVLAFWYDKDQLKIINHQPEDQNRQVANYGGTSTGDQINLDTVEKGSPVPGCCRKFRILIKFGWQEKSMFGYMALFAFCGMMTGIHWQFFFGYLAKISGDKFSSLAALTIPVQALGGELLFFMISGRILKAIGPFPTLTLCLASFSTRYLLYAYFISKISNPYWILVVEILQGPAFGLMYSVLTQQAFYYSKRFDEHNGINDGQLKSSLHATLQGILGASFEGFGVGLGAVVGGTLFDKNPIIMWKAAGYSALAMTILCTMIIMVSRLVPQRLRQRVDNVDAQVG